MSGLEPSINQRQFKFSLKKPLRHDKVRARNILRELISWKSAQQKPLVTKVEDGLTPSKTSKHKRYPSASFRHKHKCKKGNFRGIYSIICLTIRVRESEKKSSSFRGSYVHMSSLQQMRRKIDLQQGTRTRMKGLHRTPSFKRIFHYVGHTAKYQIVRKFIIHQTKRDSAKSGRRHPRCERTRNTDRGRSTRTRT